MDTVLDVERLRVDARASGSRPAKPIVRDLTFTIAPGEIVAIVGESGSGKSTVCLAALRLLAGNVDIVGGSIRFCGDDLVGMPEDRLRKVRGAGIGMILQDPLSSLDPVRRIGAQLAEPRLIHGLDHRADAARWAERTLTELGFGRADRTVRDYPSMLSGGMRQRVCAGIAYAAGPKLVVADEPTTALDVSLQGRLLRILLDLRDRHGTSMLLVSHDVSVVRAVADRVVVMYGGVALESGPTRVVLREPASPYTRALLATIPTLEPRAPGERLATIPLAALPPAPEGCPFAGRCPNEIAPCRQSMPPEVDLGGGHRAACWNPGDR